MTATTGTTTTTTPGVTVAAAPAERLRAVLLADAVVTGGVGIATVLAAPALAGDLPGGTTVFRGLGVLLVVVAVDIALAARVRTARLPLVGTVVGELALAWAVVSSAVVLVDGAGAAVTAAVLLVAATCVAFGAWELRLAGALRRP